MVEGIGEGKEFYSCYFISARNALIEFIAVNIHLIPSYTGNLLPWSQHLDIEMLSRFQHRYWVIH